MRHRSAALVAACALLASLATMAAPSGPAAATPTIGHVFTIVLENTTWEDVNSTTGRGQMPYLHGLESQGVQLDRMYGVSHASLTNYIAMTSGNPPNAKTQADCFSYNCVFESPADQNIGDQLDTAGYSWKAYLESMPAPCAHGTENASDPYIAPYATRHNPFVYYRDVVGNATRCAAHDVPYAPGFAADVAGHTIPNYSLIVPNTCNDAHDLPTCNLATADTWLSANVPQILNSPEYQADGLLIITFDESNLADTRGCCGNAAGGHEYTLVLSPKIPAGTRGSSSAVPYSHYSLLRTVEDNFGVPCLQHACDAGSQSLGSDVFGTAADDFSATSPYLSVKAGTTASTTLATTVTNGNSQSVSFSTANTVAGLTVAVTPATVAAGGTAVVSVTATSTASAVKSTIDLLATGAGGATHVVPIPVDLIRGTTPFSQVRNGNFESGVIAPWTFPSLHPPTLITPGALGAGAIRQHDSTTLRQGGVLVPAGARTFELRVRIACTDVRNYARATVRDSVTKITTVLVPNVCTNTGAWSTITAPATAWRGHKVGIALVSHKALAAPTSIDVDWDEVTFR